MLTLPSRDYSMEPYAMKREIVQELEDIAGRLEAYTSDPSVTATLDALSDLQASANEVGKAWSRSWLGYHANVYYAELREPPVGAHFSSEWGFDELLSMGTRGDWREYKPAQVRAAIFENAGNPDLAAAKDVFARGEKLVEECRAELQSILEPILSGRTDNYLTRLNEEITSAKAKVFDARDIVKAFQPSGKFISRDMRAIGGGLWTPPHISVLAEVAAYSTPKTAAEALAEIARKIVAHLQRSVRQAEADNRIGNNVFIGHGRSRLWKDLKDFIDDRLRLPWDEFNRVPVAGVTNTARLADMLDSAAVAFIVLTAEDEQADGKIHARMNAIHEVGLFQGRLGFTKAIVLLEEGCEEFSNINGLGQIRFPAGNISMAFEEVRRVLEREGLIES